jgi:hypothetical protein
MNRKVRHVLDDLGFEMNVAPLYNRARLGERGGDERTQ